MNYVNKSHNRQVDRYANICCGKHYRKSKSLAWCRSQSPAVWQGTLSELMLWHQGKPWADLHFSFHLRMGNLIGLANQKFCLRTWIKFLIYKDQIASQPMSLECSSTSGKNLSNTRMLVGTGRHPTPDRSKDMQPIEIFRLHISSIPGDHHIFFCLFSLAILFCVPYSNCQIKHGGIPWTHFVPSCFCFLCSMGTLYRYLFGFHSNDIIFQAVIEVGKHLGYDTLPCYLFLCLSVSCLIYSSRMQTLVR